MYWCSAVISFTLSGKKAPVFPSSILSYIIMGYTSSHLAETTALQVFGFARHDCTPSCFSDLVLFDLSIFPTIKTHPNDALLKLATRTYDRSF